VAKTPLETRRERLASALRANLRRRKAGRRAEPAQASDTPEKDAAQPDEPALERDVLSTAQEPR